MILLWLFLGFIVAVSIYLIYSKLHVKGKMSVGTWVLSVTTIIIGLFAIAWTIASIQENEMQAAGLGILIFGGLAVILGFVTRALISKKTKKEDVTV